VKKQPALAWTILVRLGSVTLTGLSLLVNVPLPSCPLLFSPQASSTPLARVTAGWTADAAASAAQVGEITTRIAVRTAVRSAAWRRDAASTGLRNLSGERLAVLVRWQGRLIVVHPPASPGHEQRDC